MTCHFHDGCTPAQRGGPLCDCKRLGLAGFRPPKKEGWRPWGITGLDVVIVLIGLFAIVLYALHVVDSFLHALPGQF